MGHKAFPHPWLEKIFVAGVVLGAIFCPLHRMRLARKRHWLDRLLCR